MSGSAPELSVILVTDTFASIARVLECYGSGIDRARLEIVVAAMASDGVADRVRAKGFRHVHVVEAGEGSLATAEARAVRAARAPFVVFGQHHAFPRAGFVDAIVAACATGSWTAVGAAVTNANPATSWSRAAMSINYGRWRRPAHGVMSDVPGHNTAYRRDTLLELGPELEDLLEAGWPLQLALGARGGRFFLESGASVEMTNPDCAGAFFTAFWRTGRAIAFRRRLRWPLARRLAYGFGAPVLWLVRLARTLRHGVDPGQRRGSLALVPLVGLGLAANIAGEAAGYLVGGGAPRRFTRLTPRDSAESG